MVKAVKQERQQQRQRRLTLATARHRAGAGRPVKANYDYIKGEGAPPVTHLPDPERLDFTLLAEQG